MEAFQSAKKFLADVEQRFWAAGTLCAHDDDVSTWKLLGLLRV